MKTKSNSLVLVSNHFKYRHLYHVRSLMLLTGRFDRHVVNSYQIDTNHWYLCQTIKGLLNISLVVDYFCCDRLINLEVHLLIRSFYYGLYSFSTTTTSGQLRSLTFYHRSVNWYEREMWDMYGLYTTNHPDLSRILTDYGFFGFPMRKDFPLVGYHELRYNEELKGLDYNLVYLVQDYRFFDMSNYWEI